MSKSPDAFRTISEVADWLGIQAHVLRFWESKFSQVKPVKRAGGRRYYRPADMLLLGGIKRLLHDDGMTIKGVQKLLREQGIAHVSEFSQGLDQSGQVIEGAATEVDATVVHFAPKTAPPSQPDIGGQQLPLELGADESAPHADRPPADDTPPAPAEQVAFTPTSPARSDDPRVEDVVAQLLDAQPPAPAQDPETTGPESPEPTDDDIPSQPEQVAAFEAPRTEAALPPTDEAADVPSESDPEAEPDSQAPPEPRRPRVIDISDPPEESLIHAAPGALTALADVSRLSADQAAQLAVVAQDLQDWLEQQKNLATG